MQLSIIVATIEGASFKDLNNPTLMEQSLTAAVEAGGFTLLHRYVHEFKPQGLTAMAVLSESHISLHSWPEEGILFVDLATCSGQEATEAAFNALCDHFPHSIIRRQRVAYHSEIEKTAPHNPRPHHDLGTAPKSAKPQSTRLDSPTIPL